MCRPFLADQKDFSEDKISRAGITRRFQNDDEKDVCIAQVRAYISGEIEK